MALGVALSWTGLSCTCGFAVSSPCAVALFGSTPPFSAVPRRPSASRFFSTAPRLQSRTVWALANLLTAGAAATTAEQERSRAIDMIAAPGTLLPLSQHWTGAGAIRGRRSAGPSVC
jgi:hypothetical protein